MSNRVFIATILSLTAFTASAGESKLTASDVPQAVTAAFQKAYPGAQAVEYEHEKEGATALYEVEFKLAGKEMEAVYDAQGKLIYTEEEIATRDLPPVVTAAIAKHHPKAKLEEAEKLVNPDGSLRGYEAEIKEGKKELELELDTTGKIVKVESEAKDKD